MSLYLQTFSAGSIQDFKSRKEAVHVRPVAIHPDTNHSAGAAYISLGHRPLAARVHKTASTLRVA